MPINRERKSNLHGDLSYYHTFSDLSALWGPHHSVTQLNRLFPAKLKATEYATTPVAVRSRSNMLMAKPNIDLASTARLLLPG
jgi:hypothetical protein